MTKPESLSLEPANHAMLQVAIGEARAAAEGGLPIGAALFDARGVLLGSGHNRRVQDGDPSAHGETDAFRRAGRLRSYRDVTMVTTLAPCWYCSGLIYQFALKKSGDWREPQFMRWCRSGCAPLESR